jgi:hypothetical protein
MLEVVAVRDWKRVADAVHGSGRGIRFARAVPQQQQQQQQQQQPPPQT